MLTLPQGMSREREVLLRLYGARLEIIESMGGMSEAVAAARKLAESGDAFLPDQFSNPANPAAHEATTGPELYEQLDGQIDILVCGVGTGGTITGTGRYLKARLPKLQIVAVEPAASPVLSGGKAGPHRIQGIGAGFVPPVLQRELIDEVIPISDDDAIDTAWLAARRCGVLAGLSCGAALAGAIEVGRRPEHQGKRIAVVLPDSGERYSSTRSSSRRRAANERRCGASPRPYPASVARSPRHHASIAGQGPYPSAGSTCPAAPSRSMGRPSGSAIPAAAPRSGHQWSLSESATRVSRATK